MIKNFDHINFDGGKLTFLLGGEYVSKKTGQKEVAQPAVQVEGCSRYPVKLTRAAIEKILDVFSNNADAQAFLETLP